MDEVVLAFAATVSVVASVVVGLAVVDSARVRSRLRPVRELAERWGRPTEEGPWSVSTTARRGDWRVVVLGGRRRTTVSLWHPKRALAAPPVVPSDGAAPSGVTLRHGRLVWQGPPTTEVDELEAVTGRLAEWGEAWMGVRTPLSTTEPPERRSAARVLSRNALLVGRSETLLAPEQVRGLLADADPRVAATAARSLHDLDALWAMAEGADRAARVQALVALAAEGSDPRRVERGLLRELVAPDVDDEVLDALGVVGGSDAVASLRELAGYGLQARSRRALEALTRIQARSGKAPGVLAEADRSGGELAEAPAPPGGQLSEADRDD